MCGIAGFWDPALNGPAGEVVLRRMTDRIVHRGPDAEGIWLEGDSGIGLGHRRLAIVDLSPLGAQPMASAGDRYHLAFNGEIYNFRDLRAELARSGVGFRGHSDTEVMLAAFEQWGVASAVGRFVGMFAFAVWDKASRTLTLGRDRLGEKPLYYGMLGGSVVFASELKALKPHPGWRGDIDRNALAAYMRHNYVPSPFSIYQGIKKLPAGTLVTFESPHQDSSPIAYWSLKDVAEKGYGNPFTGSEREAADALEAHLRRSVGRQMVADVPLGAFLSGGVDSSAIVAVMQSLSPVPVRTFTIGFHEQGFDEAKFAAEVSTHLGTDHTELYVSPKDALEVIPRLPSIWDEPFADSSQIPTFLVSEMTRRHVTVSLSGDGGDELLGGYSRYFQAEKMMRVLGRLPRGARKGISGLQWLLSSEALERAFDRLGGGGRIPNPFTKLRSLAEVSSTRDRAELYRRILSHWKHPESLVLGAQETKGILWDRGAWPTGLDFTHEMMYLDTMTYMPDDILVKVDRAAMAVSLETRAPFLDHELIEFAWTLPIDLKVRGGKGKWLLREVLDRYVPRTLIERPKQGFGVPLGAWLRGPLRDWADALLDPTRLRNQGYLDAAIVRRCWEDHLASRREAQYYLWDVLMFQAWLEKEHAQHA